MDPKQTNNQDTTCDRVDVLTEVSQSVDWYHEGEERVVEAGGVQVVVRFVGRKGRRGRIAITAPPGAAFQSHPRAKIIRSEVL